MSYNKELFKTLCYKSRHELYQLKIRLHHFVEQGIIDNSEYQIDALYKDIEKLSEKLERLEKNEK